MRRLLFGFLLACAVGVWGESCPASPGPTAEAAAPTQASQSSSTPGKSSPANSQTPDAPAPAAPESTPPAVPPNLAPPRSDSVNAAALDDEPGESSSKDTQIDLSPPPDDTKTHPRSSEVLTDAEAGPDSGSVSEFHSWDPHKAAKAVEVGDFYFKRKNYIAAESRYREALLYKDNDAIATFRLAVCLEKMEQPEQARREYESYLKILPHGPQAELAKKAIERLKGPSAEAKPAK